ncbi:MAG: hypothetical protein DRO46_04085, partial [Candidatus Hecatellales archaeon]
MVTAFGRPIFQLKAWLTPFRLLLVMVAAYTFHASYMTILKHYAFRSTAWDLGIFMQALWTTSHGYGILYYTPELHVNPSGCFLGQHFSPILFLLVPIYAVFPAAETLLILQALVLAAAAVPLYFAARLHLGSEKAALMVSSCYLLYLPIHELNWFDFHFEAFIPLTLLSGWYFAERKRWIPALASFLLALSCCEFMPVLVGAFGLYYTFKALRLRLLKRGGLDDRRLLFGLTLILLGFAWFTLALNVIYSLNPGIEVAGNWRNWSGNPEEVVVKVLTNPGKALNMVLTRDKLLYPLYLSAPLLFIPLAAPFEFLLLAGAWILPAWLSSFKGYYAGLLYPGFQYGGFVAAQVFIAFICGLRNLRAHRPALLRLLALASLLSLLAAAFFSPFGLGMLKPYFRAAENPEHEEALRQVLSLVPEEGSILTQNHVFPHVCHRVDAYVWPIFPKIVREPPSYAQGTDYILLDLDKAGYSMVEYVLGLLRRGEYRVIAACDYVILMGREADGKQAKVNMARGLHLTIYDGEGEILLQMPVASLETAGKLLSWREGWCGRLSGRLPIEEEGFYKFKVDSLQPVKFRVDGVERLFPPGREEP